jgi:hypothetical protein
LEQTVFHGVDGHNLVLVEYRGTLESSELRCNRRARTDPNVVFKTVAVQLTASEVATIFCDAQWRHERQRALRGSIDRAVDTHSIGVRNFGLSRRRLTDSEPALVTDNGTNPQKRKILEVDWEKIASQVLVFTAIQHGVRLTEEEARRALAGSWAQDWLVSASSLFARPTWSDSGKFPTNYVFHPMGGSVYAHIYKQNDSRGRMLESGLNREYITRVARASVVSAISSVQFEIGPLSEASIGNVGLPPNQNKMAWVDVVVTPTIGAVWMVGEDALDRYVIQRLERRIDSEVSRILIRILLNPTRSLANVLRSEKPWKRDGRS